MIAIYNGNLAAISGTCDRAGLLGVASWNGRLFALAADGLYEFSDTPSENDEVLPAFVETGDLSLAPGYECNVPRAYPLLSSEGAVSLRVTADANGRERSLEYSVPGRAGDKEREREVRLGRGQIGTAHRFRFGDFAGSASRWSLSALRVLSDRLRPRR